MDFLKILENIELTEEQIKALDKFFTEWVEKKTDEIKQQYLEANGDANVDMEKYILREEAEAKMKEFEEKCEKAFESFEDDCETAFELFEDHAQKAFDMGVSDLQKEYTENMTQALQEVYTEIQERVKQDFMESREFKALDQLKNAIIPLLDGEGANEELIAKLKTLNEEKEQIKADNQKLAKDNAINLLLKDIPKEYAETVKEFISEGVDENDVIKRFNTMMEILETKLSVEVKKEEIVTEEVKPEFSRKKKEGVKPIVEEVEDKKKEAQPSVGYETLVSKMEKEEQAINPFTEEVSELISKVFSKKK